MLAWMRARAWLVCACAILLPSLAYAHLMAAGQGAVRLVGDAAYAVISVPVAAFGGVDDNHDGLLDVAELNAHRDSVSRQVTAMLLLRNEGMEGQLIFEDLLLSHAGEPGAKGEDSLVVMRQYRWRTPVKSFSLVADIFNADATRNAQLLVRVIDGANNEVALFTRHRNSHNYFAGPWETLRDFTANGALHILMGPDHLLFLLTVLVVGAGWRYWLTVVTSFTVAHSITLVAAALGWVQAPAQLVEPMIAASIVLLALDNLMRGSAGLRQRPILVFACGLLHGMGIASALTDAGLSNSNRALSLFGFNLGVELGQIVFVMGVLALLKLAQARMPAPMHARMMRLCSLAALVLGAAWTIERTLTLA